MSKEQKKYVVVSDKHFTVCDEMYTDFYKCPVCNESYVAANYRYCQSCGVRLHWRLSNKKTKGT